MAVDITRFLDERITEDERAAHYALLYGPLNRNEIFGGQWFGWVSHAERHMPARILAECEAKRTVIAMYERLGEYSIHNHGSVGEYHGMKTSLNDVLHALAAPYCSHPDFDKGWAVA